MGETMKKYQWLDCDTKTVPKMWKFVKFGGTDVDVWRFWLEFNPACVRDLLFHDHVYKISRR